MPIRALLCSFLLTDALCGTPTLAEEQTQLDEVLVTAQKRVQDAQNVPIAMTVIEASALDDANLTEFADVAKLSPSMTITVGDQPSNSAVVIRGIGTFAFSVAVEPSVLVVLDDVPMVYQAQAFTDLLDLQRIEVLNGPQSTLFGKSASAGVVNVTTRGPTDTLSYDVSAKATDDGEQRYAFSLSGPMSDTVSYRLSAALRRFDGNVDNLASGDKTDDDHTVAMRSKIRWRPDELSELLFIAFYTQDDAHCCALPLTRLDPGAHLYGIAALPQAVFAPGIAPSSDNSSVRLGQVPVADTSQVGLSAHASHDLGPFTLLSISAVNRYRLRDLTDYDNADVDTLRYATPYANSQPPGSIPPSTLIQLHGGLLQGGDFDVKSASQELRLVSDGQHDLNYLLGAFYSNDDLTRDFGRGFVANSVAITNYLAKTHYENYALFAQSDWTFLPRTTLTVGLRLNREQSSYRFDNYYKVLELPAPGEPTHNISNVPTGKVSLQYHFTEALMAFASAARGYKGVAYDLTSGTTAQEAATFPVKVEKSTDYEIGLRSEWLHRLVLNATAYDTKYSNFQVQTVSTTLNGAAILANIPQVRSSGLEFEGTAQLSPALHATLGYAYTDARAIVYPDGQCYSGETIPASCTASPALQNLAGTTLPNAPESKITLGLDYLKPVPGTTLDADWSLSSVWQSATNFVINKDPGTVQPAYGITNTSLTLRSARRRRLSVSVFCNNLFDKHYAVNMNNVSRNYAFAYPGGAAYNQEVPRDFDRYLGVRVDFSTP